MSTSCVSFRSEYESDYAVDSRGSFEKISKQNRRPQYRRSSTPPGSVNGIHMRRSSRWNWGHGRSAQVQNLRAFARCAIAAFTALWASAASAGVVSINYGTSTVMDFVPIGNPGNVGKTVGTSGTFGSVATTFNMGRSEVSNTEYITFLNAVAKSDPYGLYNTNMGTFSTGGITRTGSSGSFVYTAKAGFENKSANFVNVYSAARFTNWLHNGAPTSVASGLVDSIINNGAYTLANVAIPTAALVRNVGAQAFLPTRDEWFKAAYYSQSLNAGSGGYFRYATSSDTLPAATSTAGDVNTNVAYYGFASSAGPMDVDGLANTVSPYGARGMFGNMAEWLQNSNTTQAFWIGGWYTMPVTGATGPNTFANSDTFAGALQSSTTATASMGFRVAAVPEPSTIMLAVLGLATVGGGEIARRRKARAAAAASAIAA